jgi:hypothetical protein
LIPRRRLCCLEGGVKVSVDCGVDSGVGIDRSDGVDNGAGVGRCFGKLVTFFAKVQKVVGPFKNRNSVGPSGVDALVNTTISWSSRVRSLICPFLVNLAMPSLSCCDDRLITSLKVCSESKYTDPTTNESAKAGADVMNNARNRDLVRPLLTTSFVSTSEGAHQLCDLFASLFPRSSLSKICER